MKSIGAGVDKGGTITLGATAQTVAAANGYRKAMTFQNTSDTEMRLTENDVAATALTGYKLLPGDAVEIETNQAVSVYCVSTGKTFAATEVS